VLYPEDILPTGPLGRVVITCPSSPPRARDVLAMRKLITPLRDLSVPEVSARLREQPEWSFENVTVGRANELRREAVTLGLVVRLEFPKGAAPP
jgi:hypothetical protein